MFTGIVEAVETVSRINERSITIIRPQIFTSLQIGQSIACNGACLSVTKYDENSISFDVLSETFRKTNLADNMRINMERAMPANGRFEGHIMLGHVDETITLQNKKEEESGVEYIFTMPSKTQYIIEKGSLSINGISLTIANCTNTTFSVYLIPITLAHTNLADLKTGDSVNIE